MTQVANVKFVDGDTGYEGLAVVRVEGKVVGLTLSLEKNGDIEVFLGAQAIEEVIQALYRARSMIGPNA
jgi:hypothetical protein